MPDGRVHTRSHPDPHPGRAPSPLISRRRHRRTLPTPLDHVLLARIAREGPLPFSEFMQAALLDPEHGYYARGPRIGPEGDFSTAANQPLFARSLARQAADAWDILGRPDPFRLLEVGGGSGDLAAGIREWIAKDPLLARVTRFALVDPSPAFAAAQRARGFEVLPSLSHLPPAPTFLVANEVLDACPVRLFVAGGLERRVTAADGRLAFVDVAADDAPPVPEGCIVEVPVGLEALLAEVARVLSPGVALFVDYGDDPVTPRPGGSIRAFARHRVESDLLSEPGTRDLTADVDFGRVRRAANACGLSEAGYTTQGRFLAALGILDDLGDLGFDGPLVAKSLILPGGMGERFKVLALARGAAPRLRGFAPPW